MPVLMGRCYSGSACSWPVCLPCLYRCIKFVTASLEQPKDLAIKAWVGSICTIPMAGSRCLGVDCSIPVAMFVKVIYILDK